MDVTSEKRKEQRLRYQWPIWYAEDFSGELCQGQMVDVSSRGAAFTCYVGESCPYPGQHIMTRFSVPRFGSNETFDMTDIIRSGEVCRVDEVNRFVRRVAMQFAQPLPFKPGEQAESEQESQERLKFVTI